MRLTSLARALIAYISSARRLLVGFAAVKQLIHHIGVTDVAGDNPHGTQTTQCLDYRRSSVSMHCQ